MLYYLEMILYNELVYARDNFLRFENTAAITTSKFEIVSNNYECFSIYVYMTLCILLLVVYLKFLIPYVDQSWLERADCTLNTQLYVARSLVEINLLEPILSCVDDITLKKMILEHLPRTNLTLGALGPMAEMTSMIIGAPLNPHEISSLLVLGIREPYFAAYILKDFVLCHPQGVKHAFLFWSQALKALNTNMLGNPILKPILEKLVDTYLSTFNYNGVGYPKAVISYGLIICCSLILWQEAFFLFKDIFASGWFSQYISWFGQLFHGLVPTPPKISASEIYNQAVAMDPRTNPLLVGTNTFPSDALVDQKEIKSEILDLESAVKKNPKTFICVLVVTITLINIYIASMALIE